MTKATPKTSLPRKSGRRSMGAGATAFHGPVTSAAESNSRVKMGTRISLSALHRERLRLIPDLGPVLPPAPKKPSLDLDYGTMEFKSLLPNHPQGEGSAYVVQTTIKSLEDEEEHHQQQHQHQQEQPSSMMYDDTQESISDSLIERFDNMESETSEPERQIVSVTLNKKPDGRLGLKISGCASGIYIDAIDDNVASVEGALKLGDRLVAINGRSLENVPYSGALELIRKSSQNVQLLVSQTVGT